MLKKSELLSSICWRMLVDAPRRMGEEDILVMKYVRRICDSGSFSSALGAVADICCSSGRIVLESDEEVVDGAEDEVRSEFSVGEELCI